MRIVVDFDVCQDHGQCAIAAPEVFDFDEDGNLVFTAEPDASLRTAVEDAADACPVQAITIEE